LAKKFTNSNIYHNNGLGPGHRRPAAGRPLIDGGEGVTPRCEAIPGHSMPPYRSGRSPFRSHQPTDMARRPG